MPMYEYVCPDCGHEFELMQKFADKPVKVCPNCKRRNVYRAIPKISVTFKGTGFYVNDSRSSSSTTTGTSRARGDSKDKAGESQASDATKSESSPAKKADASDGASGNSADAKKPAAESKPAKKD